MALSYEYSIGSVRVKEKSLLSRSDVEQLLSFNGEKDICNFLRDKGCGEGGTVDEILSSNTKAVWDYLKSVAPDFEIFNIFIISGDAHNLKVTLKGTMAGRNYDALLTSPYTVAPEEIKNAVEHNEFGKLPEWISAACAEAYEIITKKGDAREADAVIDKALMTETLRISGAFDSEFLKAYFKTSVFYNNVKIVLRGCAAGCNADYYEKALCEVEGFRKKEIVTAALKDRQQLIDLLAKIRDYGCDAAVEKYQSSPIEFEKFVDDKLILLAKESCKRTGEGAEPILGYYLGFEAEKKVINIIASGLRTNTPKDNIRERLREIYG